MVILPRRKEKRLIKFETWQIMPKGRGKLISKEGETMCSRDVGFGKMEI